MKDLEEYPKTIRKASCYISQDVSKEQLNELKKIVNYALENRILI